MIVTLLDRKWEYSNKINEIKEMFQNINRSLSELGLLFERMVIDGVEVFDNHEEYISDHIIGINSITVMTRTKRQFAEDTLLSLEQYIDRVLPILPQVAESFYIRASGEIWQQFQELLNGLEWIINIVPAAWDEEVLTSFHNTENYIKIVSKLKLQIIQLGEALEMKDHILIGDTISYEIVGTFKELQTEIAATIEHGEIRHDIN